MPWEVCWKMFDCKHFGTIPPQSHTLKVWPELTARQDSLDTFLPPAAHILSMSTLEHACLRCCNRFHWSAFLCATLQAGECLAILPALSQCMGQVQKSLSCQHCPQWKECPMASRTALSRTVSCPMRHPHQVSIPCDTLTRCPCMVWPCPAHVFTQVLLPGSWAKQTG